MKNILLLLTSIFSITSFSMEESIPTSTFDHQLIKKTLNKLSENGELDILQMAQRVCDDHIKLVKTRISEFRVREKKYSNSKDDFAYLYNNGNGAPENLLTLEGGQKSLDYKRQYKKLKEKFDEIGSTLNSELLAWSIIKNSIDFAIKEGHDVFKIIPEVAYLFMTSNDNLVNNKRKDYWNASFYDACKVLTFLLVKHNCDGLQSEKREEHEEALYASALSWGKTDYWYFVQFLIIFNDRKDIDDDSPLKLSDNDLKYFKDFSNRDHKNLPNVESYIRQTQLSKIIYSEQTKSSFPARILDLLKSYNFFLGSIDEYLKKRQGEAESALRRDDKNKQSPLKPKGQKRRVKQDKLAVSTRTGFKEVDRPLAAVRRHTRDVVEALAQDLKPLSAGADELEEGEWQLVPFKHRTKKSKDDLAEEGEEAEKRDERNYEFELVKRTLEYDNLNASILSRKVDFFEYRTVMSIWRSEVAKYVFNGEMFDTTNDFSKLENSLKGVNDDLVLYHNLAGYFITLHGLDEGGESVTHTFYGDKPYLTGPSTTAKCKNAHNSLRDAERKRLRGMMEQLRDCYIKNCLSERCEKVVEGFWLYNSLHTEPMMVIDLSEKKLAEYLGTIGQKQGKFKLTGVVIGLSSEYDICFRCRRLMQGFQWNLLPNLKAVVAKNKILQSKIEIDPAIVSMILVKSRLRVKNSDVRNNADRFIHLLERDLPELGGGQYSRFPRHQLILSEKGKFRSNDK